MCHGLFVVCSRFVPGGGGKQKPKSGRAVSAGAGEPWADKLLGLPAFLSTRTDPCASVDELHDAFRLTGYFLDRHVFKPRGVARPVARSGFETALERLLAPSAAEVSGQTG